MWRGRLSLRKLCALTSNLPETSALARIANGGRPPLTPTDLLLMDLWALKAQSMSEQNPDRHPWRAELEEQQDKARAVSRRDKLKKAAARHRR